MDYKHAWIIVYIGIYLIPYYNCGDGKTAEQIDECDYITDFNSADSKVSRKCKEKLEKLYKFEDSFFEFEEDNDDEISRDILSEGTKKEPENPKEVITEPHTIFKKNGIHERYIRRLTTATTDRLPEIITEPQNVYKQRATESPKSQEKSKNIPEIIKEPQSTYREITTKSTKSTEKLTTLVPGIFSKVMKKSTIASKEITKSISSQSTFKSLVSEGLPETMKELETTYNEMRTSTISPSTLTTSEVQRTSNNDALTTYPSRESSDKQETTLTNKEEYKSTSESVIVTPLEMVSSITNRQYHSSDNPVSKPRTSQTIHDYEQTTYNYGDDYYSTDIMNETTSQEISSTDYSTSDDQTDYPTTQLEDEPPYITSTTVSSRYTEYTSKLNESNMSEENETDNSVSDNDQSSYESTTQQQITDAATTDTSTNAYSVTMPSTLTESQLVISSARVVASEREDGSYEPAEVIWNCSVGSRWFRIGEIGRRSAELLTAYDTSSTLIIQVENMKAPSTRFYCFQPNGDTKLFQVVRLPFILIDVSKSSSFSLINQQYAVVFCPRGQLWTDNAFISSIHSTCYSRLLVKGSLSYYTPNTTLFKCLYSNTSSEQILPSQDIEKRNCSFNIFGCAETMMNPTEYEIDLNYSTAFKCRFSEVLLNQTVNLDSKTWLNTSVGVTFIYNYELNSCIPIESRMWLPEISFRQLEECNRSCRLVNKDFLKCLAPNNTGIRCSKGSNKGRYYVTYNASSGKCAWIFVWQSCHETVNKFSSISECNRVCNGKNIQRMNKEKLCGKTRSGFVFSRKNNNCTFITKGNLSKSLEQETELDYEFKSLTECLDVCKRKQISEICNSKLDPSLLYKYHPSYRINSLLYHHVSIQDSSSKCVAVIYRSSHLDLRTLNLFPTKRSCELICMNAEEPENQQVSFNSSVYIVKPKYAFNTTAAPKLSTEKIVTKSPVMRSYLLSRLTKHTSLDIEPCFQTLPKYSTNHSVLVTKFHYDPSLKICIRVKLPDILTAHNIFDKRRSCLRQCIKFHVRMHKKCFNDPNKFPSCWPDPTDKSLNKVIYYLLQPETGVNYKPSCQSTLVRATKTCLSKFMLSRELCEKTCPQRQPTDLAVQDRCLGQPLVQYLPNNCNKKNITVRWAFLRQHNLCFQFKICRTNYLFTLKYPGNAFVSELDCKQHCVSQNIKDICKLRKDHGVGHVHSHYWFYDYPRAKCAPFIYAGSLGNKNRFLSQKSCEKTCYGAFPTNWTRLDTVTANRDEEDETTKYDWRRFAGRFTKDAKFRSVMTSDICLEDINFGTCNIHNTLKVYILKYHYNPIHGVCQGYLHGGCGIGSRNAFMHKEICNKVCTKRQHGLRIPSLCKAPVDKCTRNSSQKKHKEWRLNLNTNQCYAVESCESRVALKSREICQNLCVLPILQLKDLSDICHLPPDQTTCDQAHRSQNDKIIPDESTIKSWYFDHEKQKCISYEPCISTIYKSLQYGNNFPSENTCNRACNPVMHSDICQLPMDRGPCTENIPLYYYDWRKQKCIMFKYSGCLGNRNRFINNKKCEEVCGKSKCRWFIENEHKCRGRKYRIPSTKLYYYNGDMNKCVQLTKPTCLHSEMFYLNITKCDNECVLPAEMSHVAYLRNINLATKTNKLRCNLALMFNSYPLCNKNWFHRYYYNPQSKKCEFFYYNGCDKIEDLGNRFTDIKDCEVLCMDKKDSNKTNLIVTINETSSKLTQSWNRCASLVETICESKGNVSKQCNRNEDCREEGMICCECYDTGYIRRKQCLPGVGCRLSKYGCCQGEHLAAKDETHSNCKRQHPQIISISPINQVKDVQLGKKFNMTVTFSGEPRPDIHFIRLNQRQVIIPKIYRDPLLDFWRASLQFDKITAHQCGTWKAQLNESVASNETQLRSLTHQLILDCTNELYYALHLVDPKKKCQVGILAELDDTIELYCPLKYSASVLWKGPNNVTISTNTRYLVLGKVQATNSGIWHCSSEHQSEFCFRLITYSSSIQNTSIGSTPVRNFDKRANDSYIFYSMIKKNVGVVWLLPVWNQQYNVLGISRTNGSLLFWFSYQWGQIGRLQFSKLLL